MDVVLAVVNPRGFSYFREKLSQLGIGFTVPRELPYECRKGTVVLTDRPRETLRGKDCIVVETGDSPPYWEKAVGRLMAALSGREAINTIVAGIDTGERMHALVVIGDGMVIHQAKLDEEALIEALKRLLKTPHKTARVRVGAIQANMDKAVELAWRIVRETGLPVELADEQSTTKSRKSGGKSRIRDSDLNAAYLIATQAPTIASLGRGKAE